VTRLFIGLFSVFGLVACGQSNSFKETLELTVDENKVLNLVSTDSGKSVWTSHSDLRNLTQQACHLARDVSEARAKASRAGTAEGVLGASRQSSEVIKLTARQEESRTSSTNQSKSSSVSISEISLEPLDIDLLTREGVRIEVIQNIGAHIELSSRLKRDFKMNDVAKLVYQEFVFDEKSKLTANTSIRFAISKGQLRCEELREVVLER